MRAIPSILVIDDNRDALDTLACLLSALGAKEVRRAASAERALEILQKRSFSLIISDYRLEGMDGVEFLETLRSRGDQTPMVILSGAPEKAGVIRACQHSRVDFFPKPFEVTELVEAVERLSKAA